MKKIKRNELLKKLTIYTFLFVVAGFEAFSQQRVMEKLNRGVVAVESTDGVFLSWRKFANEPDSITFNIYRDKVLLNPTPIEDVSNFLDSTGTTDNYYYVEALLGGSVIDKSNPVMVWEDGYKEIPLQTPAGYAPNDASMADLDGDGELEIVVKMEGSTRDNSQSGTTDPVFLHAYELNGTLLWSIDLGINIRGGAHYTQFMVYDLDGDGLAEVACKTAPGTMDGTGSFLSDGPAANDDDAADYRNGNGYILTGPEYLTLFDGKTGAEISTKEYYPVRGNVNSWGDGYGNRVDRFLACVAYFDSLPSLVMCRGYYTRTTLAAWDYVNGELVQRWIFDTDSSKTGKDGNSYNLYTGQGAHSITVGDVDSDGKDEIVYGAMTVDDDGVGLYVTGNNHGDATHLGDFLPNRPGLEYFMPSETAYRINSVTGDTIPGVYVTDAATGMTIWEKEVTQNADIGRAMVANVTADYPGCEFWASSGLGVYAADGSNIPYSSGGPSINFGSWWDGDLERELLNSNAIKEWGPSSNFSWIEPAECESNNGTKATPALSGDIIGDWREEVIWRTSDNQTLRIYSTPLPTQYGFYTLLQDPQYRLAITWQNVGYNQPPHPSFYIGDGMAPLPQPSIAIVSPNIGPYLEISSPSYGYELGLGNSIYVSVNAVGFDDTTTVSISHDGTLLATIDNFPYVVLLDTLGSGTYNLVASALDGNSNLVESGVVPITVDEGFPTLVFKTPEDGAIYTINDSITFSAEATDTNGTIDSVNYYLDGVSIATLTDSPYTVTIGNPGYGVYTLYAIATDNDGKTDTSDTRTIVIGESTIIQENETGFCGFLTSGTVDSNNAGFTGAGFANTSNENGAGVSWGIEIFEEGEYQIYFRYAAGNQRPATLTLNDTIVLPTLDFVDTDGSWTTWYMQSSEPVFLSRGDYEVKLTATGGDGLGNIDYLQVLAFSNTAAGPFDCELLSTSIGRVPEPVDELSIFPVPSDDVLNVQLLAAGSGTMKHLELFDFSGKTILTQELATKETQLDVSRLAAGMYFVKVESNTGKKWIKRFSIK